MEGQWRSCVCERRQPDAHKASSLPLFVRCVRPRDGAVQSGRGASPRCHTGDFWRGGECVSGLLGSAASDSRCARQDWEACGDGMQQPSRGMVWSRGWLSCHPPQKKKKTCQVHCRVSEVLLPRQALVLISSLQWFTVGKDSNLFDGTGRATAPPAKAPKKLLCTSELWLITDAQLEMVNLLQCRTFNLLLSSWPLLLQ